ncbi:MAG TPA: hypothetical protein VK327_05435, partial [Candidatus Paceibacterota bacterium]|nr:hypothetical protein [Candidatus Paceibacterota bacterium]
ANRQGVWIGIGANLVFTAWATLTSGKNKMFDLGDYNFALAGVMIGVIGHLIVLAVGYIASLFFPANPDLKPEWTLRGWLEKGGRLSGKGEAGGENINASVVVK